MSTKRPLIKYKNPMTNKICIRKVPTNYVNVWKAFKATWLQIDTDVKNKKYTYDNIIDIVFEHNNTKRKIKL